MGKVIFGFNQSVLLQHTWHCPDNQISGSPANSESLQALKHLSQHSEYEVAETADR